MTLLVDEHIQADSTVVRTHLRVDGDHVHVDVEGGTSGTLSASAIMHVIRRYARPLDPEVAALVADAPRIALPGGAAIALLHWRAAVDAAGRDWLVLLVPGDEPQAALSGGVAAALRYLVLRLQDERGA
ncbi:MAG TPA: hypothetical protein VM261_05575 [Kofleriaceae bacterium]|nr:hypothetical protein [Kofleriaceae bacterium]